MSLRCGAPINLKKQKKQEMYISNRYD
uniref:Uncharacterized protein n=1 Tax=Arundo donax TaxID=35708 RepID=A0A0A9AKA4_ARUDO